MDKIKVIEEDIRNLKIQGATNIALAVIDTITEKDLASSEILSVARRLAYARPTEPLAQNALRYIFSVSNQNREYYQQKATEYKEVIQKAKQEIIINALSLIQNEAVYLTHCHSQTVVAIFKKAKSRGKSFTVYATETRPLYQGRITVRELAEAGFEEVTLIIDDVAESLIEGRLKQIDAVFIGADLLSEKGFVNKVGSLGIARAAERRGIPLYCLTTLLKYDPRPFNDDLIEKRSGEEIWDSAPKDVRIYAPAFDFIPYLLNIKIVCEKGVFAGSGIKSIVRQNYPFLFVDKSAVK